MLPKKAGLQTFLHSQAPSQTIVQWRERNQAKLNGVMLRSHNGVHCCGTVGDSHSSSQLIAAKRTFTGDSLQNHDAKVLLFHETTYFF